MIHACTWQDFPPKVNSPIAEAASGRGWELSSSTMLLASQLTQLTVLMKEGKCQSIPLSNVRVTFFGHFRQNFVAVQECKY
eukprot:79561-Pelagomonas_calceolata.AAC.1